MEVTNLTQSLPLESDGFNHISKLQPGQGFTRYLIFLALSGEKAQKNMLRDGTSHGAVRSLQQGRAPHAVEMWWEQLVEPTQGWGPRDDSKRRGRELLVLVSLCSS